MSGKDFRHGSVKRNRGDFYQTPPSITFQLIENEKFQNPILEPSCGDDAITNVLTDAGYQVVGKDLKHGHDFLLEKEYFPSIITNPPFSLATEFVLKINELEPEKAALLLPLDYLHGTDRYKTLFICALKVRLSKVYVLVRRPMLTEDKPDEEYGTGAITFAWFIFENGYIEDPLIRWIDNNAYVRGSKKYTEEKTQGILDL